MTFLGSRISGVQLGLAPAKNHQQPKLQNGQNSGHLVTFPGIFCDNYYLKLIKSPDCQDIFIFLKLC